MKRSLARACGFTLALAAAGLRTPVARAEPPAKPSPTPAKAPETLVDPSGLPVEVRGVLEGDFAPDLLPKDPSVVAVAPYLGKPVRRAYAVIAPDSFQDAVVPTLTVPAGATFSAELARTLLRKALGNPEKSGPPTEKKGAETQASPLVTPPRFADGFVSVVPEGDGVAIVITLKLVKVLGDITVDMHDAPFSREELLRALEVSPGSELSAGDIARMATAADEFFVARGYPDARIFLDVRQASRAAIEGGVGDARLVLDITPGAPDKLQRRTFVVAAGEYSDVAADIEKYSVRAGARADKDVVTVADGELEQRLRSRGYLQATVRSQLSPEAGGSRLTVTATLGPRSEPRFEGAFHYDADALRGALDLEHETDRTAGHLADRLRAFYKSRGFFDARVDVEYRGGAVDRLHLLVFHIVENERVSVGKRLYPCLTAQSLAGAEMAPKDAAAIGTEIDSFLEEDLPGADLTRGASPAVDDELAFGSGRADGAGSLTRVAPRRAAPNSLDPKTTFVAETYDRAAEHLQSLYRADGFLAATVGPVQPMRRACAKGTPPDVCLPVESKLPARADLCVADVHGVPQSPPDVDPRLVCVPDATTGATCESTMDLQIPINLGPRTLLWDVQFPGARTVAPADLLSEANLALGGPLSTLALDDAGRKIVALYQERGYAFAQAKWSLDKSSDQTRGRVRFEIAEGDLVNVESVEIHGNRNTKTSIIQKRLALEVGQPYTTSRIRRTQELLGSLGVFSSIDVRLEDPFLPQKRKKVIVTLSERPTYVAEASGGFYTAEGFRVGGELGDRNIGGRAISFGLVGNVAYLPTPLIIDPGARANFDKLDFGARIAGRLTASLQVPETGLGPLFRAALDGIAVHDLQRDFYVRKFAVAPSLTFSPARNLQIQFSPSVEANAARIFGVLTDVGPSDPRARAFTYPEGATYAFAQKLSLSWDRRDNSLNASRGTFFSFGIEHVDAFPVGSSDDKGCSQDGSFCASHFIKFQTTISGYVPIYHRLRLAVEMRAGINVPLVASSKTYPDRLFFLGGAESMRAYQPNTFIPQDQADVLDPAKLPIVRGGDLLLNPHAELRIPLTTTLETVAFCDMGNLWRDPAYYPWKAAGHMAMHYAIGTGLRLMTPVFPLAFDIGINPAPRTWESRYAINFRIGLF